MGNDEDIFILFLPRIGSAFVGFQLTMATCLQLSGRLPDLHIIGLLSQLFKLLKTDN